MGFFARRVYPDVGYARSWVKRDVGNKNLGIRKKFVS
jgi:hypothetical protein